MVHYYGGSEEHSLLVPKIMKESRISKKYVKSTYIPSLFSLTKDIIRIKPNYIIFRDLSITSLCSIAISLIVNKDAKRILYTQNSVYLTKNDTLRNKIKNKYYSFFYNRLICYSPVMFENYFDKNPENVLFENKLNFVPLISDIPQKITSREYLKDRKINILSVGKFRDYKNHYLLVDAFSQLSENDKKEFNVTIIGEAQSPSELEYMNNFKRYIQKFNLQQYFSLLKNVDYKEMENHYFKNDVFVLTSKREVASIALIESMAHGMVPISTSQNGTSTYIDESNGFIFESNNSLELCKILKNLINRKKEIRIMGLNSFNHIEKNYTEKNFIKKFNEVIEI